ncbi:MAG: hypothetical protein HY084_12000 [Gemmatimonadetes bacterium]|nr:hypothetical protein [Gemmatimonadota bacterium]
MIVPETQVESVSGLLSMATGVVALATVSAFAAAIIWRVYTGKIDLTYLIGDAEGSASMSRFQLLLFSFVVAFAFLFVVTKPDAVGFPVIPGSVLTLIGISGSSFLVGKSMDKQPSDGAASGSDGQPSLGDSSR